MIGTQIGFYEIKKQLGQGGMGAVYLAEHTRIGNRKVVKVLLPEMSRNEQVVYRFENEARASARLNHRNIIKIDDFGLLPNGQWYILMPFLEGTSLEDFLAQHGTLSIHQTLHILVQVCAALHAAHAAGIVHRDLKPANIFLTRTEENPHHVTLLDFGIAKLSDTGDAMATQTGAAFGTPLYMAVEQFEDASRADARSDIYALGVIGYQMLTGTLPFGSAPSAVLYNKQITTRPPRPARVPYEWAEIVMRALAVRPIDRPQTVHELALALAAATPQESPAAMGGQEILATYARELMTQPPGMGVAMTQASSPDMGMGRAWPTPPPISASSAGPGQVLTTLSSMQSQHVSGASRPTSGRKGWWLGAAMLGIAGLVTAGVIASRQGGGAASGSDAGPAVVTAGEGEIQAGAASGGGAGAASQDAAAKREGAGVPDATGPTGSLPLEPMPPTATRDPGAAHPALAELRIESSPPGAKLWVDDREVGTAPQAIQVPLNQELVVRAELQGRSPTTRKLQPRELKQDLLLRLERSRPSTKPADRDKPEPAKSVPFDPNGVGGV